MTKDELIKLVQEIVAEAKSLSAKHTDQAHAPVNYACVFSQSENAFEKLLKIASHMGRVVQETKMGPVLQIEPIETTAGFLEVLKIRKPDLNRPEKGDADFTVEDYQEFKTRYLKQTGFSLIERPGMEMVELADPSFSALAYYSYPILSDSLKLKLQHVIETKRS